MTDAGGRPAAEPTAEPAVRAWLYDARGEDREVDLRADPPRRIRDHQLLWIDVVGRDRAAIDEIAATYEFHHRTAEILGEDRGELLLRRYDAYLHVGLRSAEGGPVGEVAVVGFDLVVARNLVLTVRNGPIAAFERFRDQFAGVSELGRLDTATFTSALVDEVLAGYLLLVEDLEQRMDELDEVALRTRNPASVVDDLAELRARAATLRRALAPHRQAFSALAQPDFAMPEHLGRPWPGLLERLDTTLAAMGVLMAGTLIVALVRDRL